MGSGRTTALWPPKIRCQQWSPAARCRAAANQADEMLKNRLFPENYTQDFIKTNYVSLIKIASLKKAIKPHDRLVLVR
jgi:hypothetical protein